MRIVIVGGGCSGVVAAIKAKNSNNEVILLERGKEVLKKLLMTGNGRCNYYHEDQELYHYHSRSGKVDSFVTKENLSTYLSFMDQMGIIPKIKNGYYYPCTNQASTVRDSLLVALKHYNIDVRCDYLVEKIEKKGNQFLINDEILCDTLVISTGSFAYPKTGSDGMGYSFLEMLSHKIVTPYPSLVPLKSNRRDMKYLSGVRADVCLSLYSDKELISQELGEVQFTDYGISGICTFNLSYFANILLFEKKNVEIQINFVPFIEEDVKTWLEEFNQKTDEYTIEELLEKIVPKKIVPSILRDANIDGNDYYEELDHIDKEHLADTLTHFSFPIIGSLDFEHSQVCSGGVSLEEIDLSTCRSLKDNNLYIVGELLDITGDCGGYNLTIAFMSGLLAGRSIYDSSKTD